MQMAYIFILIIIFSFMYRYGELVMRQILGKVVTVGYISLG